MAPSNSFANGLPGSLRALGTTLLALVCARAELIAVELQEERERAGQELMLAVLAALFLAMGMLLSALLVVVLFWDTHRVLAAGSVTSIYLVIGAGALVRLWVMKNRRAAPFSATMSEFANDLKLLRDHDE